MAKIFYTEHEIEDMVQRGTTSIRINDDVVLTELAYEKAERLGVELVRDNDKSPQQIQQPAQITRPVGMADAPRPPALGDLKTRVRAAVYDRLGAQVDPHLLDKIIDRVVSSIDWNH